MKDLEEESESRWNEDILKSGSGANLNPDLWQQTQYHRGVVGQTCILTTHLNNLWFLTSPVEFSPWQKPNSGDSNGTDAEQKLHVSTAEHLLLRNLHKHNTVSTFEVLNQIHKIVWLFYKLGNKFMVVSGENYVNTTQFCTAVGNYFWTRTY